MSKDREIKELLKDITRESGVTLFVAEIVEVGETTCNVKLGEQTLTGVKNFCIDEKGSLLIKPTLGSMVTVLDFGDLRDMQIIKVNKIESILYLEGGLIIEFDSKTNKVDIRNNVVSFKELLQSLADIIKTLTISTPAGPSGTPLPPTMQAVTQFETKFKQLLK